MTKSEKVKFEIFKIGYTSAMEDLGLDYDGEDYEESLRKAFDFAMNNELI